MKKRLVTTLVAGILAGGSILGLAACGEENNSGKTVIKAATGARISQLSQRYLSFRSLKIMSLI